jgi:hypothetical protein
MTEQSELVQQTEVATNIFSNEINLTASPEQFNATNLRSPNPSPLLIEQKTSGCFGSKAVCPEMENTSKMMSKLISFFTFHYHMALKDPMSQWRLDTIVRNLPSAK